MWGWRVDKWRGLFFFFYHLCIYIIWYNPCRFLYMTFLELLRILFMHYIEISKNYPKKSEHIWQFQYVKEFINVSNRHNENVWIEPHKLNEISLISFLHFPTVEHTFKFKMQFNSIRRTQRSSTRNRKPNTFSSLDSETTRSRDTSLDSDMDDEEDFFLEEKNRKCRNQ